MNIQTQTFQGLSGAKALGIDKVTKEEYGKNLEINIETLIGRIRTGGYHPNPSRIVEIPKSDGSKRPLAIACFEDKMVQEAVRTIIEQIYEPIFLETSHGFRPKLGCMTALTALNKNLSNMKCGAVIEVDLQKYFNTIPHEPLMRMLAHKIKDQRFLRLVCRLLKAPTINKSGNVERNEIGIPQGSILSPLLANIYLHYVVDLWIRQRNARDKNNWSAIVRYADDSVPRAQKEFGNVIKPNKFCA